MTIPTPMRECCANAARKYLERCADLGTAISYADLTDAVLAEIETPTEVMLRAYTLGLRILIAETPAGERSKWIEQKYGYKIPEAEKAAARYRAMIRAAREGR